VSRTRGYAKNLVPHDLDVVPVLFEERKEIEGKAEGQEKWDKNEEKVVIEKAVELQQDDEKAGSACRC
jgi:hypothetical protein